MDSRIVSLGFLLLVAVSFLLLFLHLKRRASSDKHRTTSLLSAIQFSEEDLDAQTEIKEIKSRRRKFYRISGFKWILSFVFTLGLLFMATFEFWIDYYPVPKSGDSYGFTLRAAYPFSFQEQRYHEGGLLIERGKMISDRDTQLVQAYRGQKPAPSFLKILGYFTQFLIFTLFLVYWLMLFLPEIRDEENKNLVFIFMVIMIVLAIAKFSFLTGIFSLYYIPLSMLAMLVNILIFNRIVPSVIIFTSLFVAIVTEFNIHILLVLFAGGMVTIFWLQKVKKRSQVITAGMAVGVTNLIVYLSIVLMKGDDVLSSVVKENAFASLFNGLLSAFLALGLIPIFEKFFSYLSPFRLMELSDLDSELLRELYLKAPGTYHHSLSVANLAEIAANAIDADALLLRVGSYYHDIGKMFKPKFFAENIDPNTDNPHVKISPYASSKVLKSHITLGMEVGEKYGLPKKIIELIPQHHGTTIMDYFYEKARSTADKGSISEKYFSYPGPRPRTKEAAILMIVDSVEAASRVLSDHSEDTVRKMIEKIVNHKLEQGQLDDAPLTIYDLRQITYALAKALSSSTHKRIDYPTNSGISSQFNVHPAAPADAGGHDQPAGDQKKNGGDDTKGSAGS